MSKADSNNKYTYSWTKNKGLLPIKTEMEKYEILYPGGSILQVSRIEVSEDNVPAAFTFLFLATHDVFVFSARRSYVE